MLSFWEVAAASAVGCGGAIIVLGGAVAWFLIHFHGPAHHPTFNEIIDAEEARAERLAQLLAPLLRR
ncbi:hypothetical protein [Labrys monachus]|uniref:Uncharacterized protein n=1 Tax=Labrys monachus TaxID=217067 RepID=A0ABU0FDH1_9HYPH|nr:hypothetical protein [Labrys monachus]MDQ0392652.1 hypothetical protein [Labrys monachus]